MINVQSVYSFIILFLYLCTSVNASSSIEEDTHVDSCRLPVLYTDQRPEKAGEPTKVMVGLRLLDVTSIQDTSQSITSDFVVSQTWTDPRLVGYEGCQFSIDDVWTPQIDIINAGRLFTRLNKYVNVIESGQVQYFQRYQGSLVFHYDAHNFPFDKHEIVFNLLSIEYEEKNIQLVVDKKITGEKSNEYNVPDWKIKGVQASVDREFSDAFDNYHSVFKFVIQAERRSDFYIWKVILPLTLIVIMSWTVFWIDPSQSGSQIGMSATSMLTLIAFQFTMANILPRLSYYTLLDRFLMGSTALVFLSLIESVATSHLVSKNQELALRIDRLCRWAFPCIFIILSLFVFVI